MRVAAPGKAKDPFSAALDAVRDRLGSGRLAQGEPLTVTDLAHDLGLSATPIREALSRLAGEGLIEDRRGRGYFARRIDIADLIELYDLRRVYVLSAISPDQASVAMGPEQRVAGDFDPLDRTLRALDRLVAAAGNRALLDAYSKVSERLAPATHVEPAIFALADDARVLEALASAGSAERIQVVSRFHDARRLRAGDLVRAMRARSNIADL